MKIFGQKPLLGTPLKKGHPLAKGLVGCWLFNEGSGDKVADLSGNGSTGTFTGSAPPTWVSGRRGSATNHTGSDGYIDCGNRGVLSSRTAFTIIAHNRLTSLNNADALCGSIDDTTHQIGMLTSEPGIGDNNDIRVSVKDGLNTYGYTTADLNVVGVWNDWAVVFNGSGSGNADRLKFYHNAVLQSLTFVGTIPASTAVITSPFSIGAWGAGVNDWTGDISHVFIYNRALSAQEIQQLYFDPFCMFQREAIELWSAASGGAAGPLEVYVWDTAV